MINQLGSCGGIESLGSLSMRLADSMSVAVIELYADILVPFMYQNARPPRRVYLPCRDKIDGMGGAAQAWSAALGKYLGCSDFRRATLLPWGGILSAQRLLKAHRAWCPDCFREMSGRGEPVHELLAWRLREMGGCPVHRAPLVGRCPHCGRDRQPYISEFGKAGRCHECGGELWRSGARPESPQVAEVVLRRARLIADILQLGVRGGCPPDCSSGLLIRNLREAYFKGSKVAMARIARTTVDDLERAERNADRVSLSMLLNIAISCNLSARQLFGVDGDVPCCDTVLDTRSGRATQQEDPGASVPDDAPTSKDAMSDGLKSLSFARRTCRQQAELVDSDLAQSTAGSRNAFEAALERYLTGCQKGGALPTIAGIQEVFGGSCISDTWRRSILERKLSIMFGHRVLLSILYGTQA
ncbi:TniQ family protein [Burkholderia sp. PU8-34]